MATKLGSTTISKLYLGSTEITKAYLGSTEVYSSGAVVNDAFELTVETTAANETFLLPLTGVTSINVAWGDGTVDTGITSNNPTHEYATAGTHSISVTGSATSVVFDGSGSESKLRTVTNLGSLGWTNLQDAFHDCSSMTSFVCGDTDTSNVTTMFRMFRDCTSLTTLDLSTLDTSSVNNMRAMFLGCSSLTTLDVSGFDTSSVTDINFAFQHCSSLVSVNLSGFNTSSVTSMQAVFENCSSLENLDIDGWDVTSVIAATSFLFGANNALTTAQYDAVLIAWAAQSVQSDVTIHFGDAIPTASGQAARDTLVGTYGWTITDGEGTFEPVSGQFTLTIPAANTASLTDFPIYVDLSDMPAGFWSTVTNGGGDIRVYESDGTTELPREVVSCDTATDTGELHFKGDVSALSDTDFIITVDGTSSDYAVTDTYGRNAVWSDYELVFHGEDATTNSAGTALTETGSVSIGTGKIGSAGVFSASTYSSLSTSNYSGVVTLQAWCDRLNTTGQRFLSIANVNSSSGQLNICLQNGRSAFQINKPNGATDIVLGGILSANTFYMLHGVKNGDASHSLYEDGALADSNTLTAVFNPINNMRVGASADLTPFSNLNNTDEARIRFTALSSDWIATEYANQSNPSTFYTIT